MSKRDVAGMDRLGVASRTPRDEARKKAYEEAAAHWAEVDSHIAEALGDTIPNDELPPAS